MPYATDGLVGKLAVQKGLITAATLKECLAEQSASQKAGQKRPLGVILVSRGLMKDEDLLGLLEEQKRILVERSNYAQVRKDDFLFGQILLKQGQATSDQVNQALRLQAEAAERGEMPVPRLGQILIEMGVAEEKAIQRTLKIQYKTLYECPGCTLKFNVVEADAGKQYRCKKCGQILVPKPPGTGIKADESAYGMKLEVSRDLPPEVAQAELDPASAFGKYVLVRELGRGGSGTVHLAYQKELKRYVALKLLRAEDEETLRRFTREAQMAARLKHPGIVSVYETGTALNVPYIALEFIDGQSLDDVPPPSFRRACRILCDVATAVHYAHERGVIHRDLKPQNILIDREGRACVTDFGLAREVSAPGTLTEKGIVVGTPAYMSPEQAAGDLTLDGRSDVASLGAVFYELITGKTPFTGKTQIEIALNVLNAEPEAPRTANPAVPSDLQAICLMAMAKDRTRRYPTARAFAEDLQRYLEGEPVTAVPSGVVSQTVHHLRRHRFPALVALVAAVALLVTGIALSFAGRESRARAALVQARELEAAGKLEEALRLYDSAPDARKQADQVRAAIRRRDALALLGGDTPAEQVARAERALQLHPGLEEAHLFRASALVAQAREAPRDRAPELLRRAEEDLAAVRDHSLLQTVRAAVAEARRALEKP